MTIGYKRQHEKGPLYHPERDYAYITPTLMGQAVANMSSPDPTFAEYRTKHNITDDELAVVATALAHAQRSFVSMADPVKSLEHALNREDWHVIRQEVKTLLMWSIGEVILAAWFKAVREVSIVGEESPAQNEMCRFSSLVREFAAKHGAPAIDVNTTAEVAIQQIDRLFGKLEAAGAYIQQLKNRINELEQDVRLAKEKLAKRWWSWIFALKD